DPALADAVLLQLEGAGAGRDHLAEVALVVVDRLLRGDDGRRPGQHFEQIRDRLAERDDDGVGVGRIDLVDRGEQALDRADRALRRRLHAVDRGDHVGRGERRAVVELDALAQLERVGLAVARLLVRLGELRHDRLQAVERVEPHEVRVHVPHRGRGRALDRVEVVGGDAERGAQDAALLRRAVGRTEDAVRARSTTRLGGGGRGCTRGRRAGRRRGGRGRRRRGGRGGWCGWLGRLGGGRLGRLGRLGGCRGRRGGRTGG